MIPVSRTVLDSWRLLIDHAPGMLRAGWMAAILAILLEALVYWTFPDYLASTEQASPEPGIFPVLLTAIPYTVLFVPWYRAVLLGEQPVRGVALWRMQIRHFQFLWRWVPLGIAPLIILFLLEQATYSQTAVLVSLAEWLILPTGLATIYIVVRLFMMVPAAALGHVDGIGRAWRLTRGNGWRLFVIQLLAMLPLIIVLIALVIWQYSESPPDITLLFVSIMFVMQIVLTNAVALCYRALGGMDGSAPAPKDTE